MIDRRFFSFGALLAVGATASTVAHAGLGEGVSLRPTYQIGLRRGVLEVQLALTNASSGSVELQTLLGSRPGPRLEAHRVGAPAGEMLMEIVKLDRREMVSRMGPPPTYVAVAAGHTINIGTYRYETGPEPLESVELFLTAYTDRDIVELPGQIVGISPRAAV